MKNLISLASIIILSTNLLFAQIINIPADYPTIQEGIDAAIDGDTVLVAPGTYYENIKINNKGITLSSWILTTQDTSLISQTIIDGSQMGSGVQIKQVPSWKSLYINGFTIRNGSNFMGGGVFMSSSTVSLDNLKITNNDAISGGGICNYNGILNLDNSIIEQNSASSGNGGGLYFTHNPSPCDQQKHLKKSCTVRGGSNIRNTIIRNNVATERGGGYCNKYWRVANFENCLFENNIAGTNGGGFYSEWEGVFYLKNVKFFNNNAGICGGGFYVFWAEMDMNDIEVGYNSAKYGGGMYIASTATPGISNYKNIFIHNNTAQDSAGGLYLTRFLEKFQNLTLADNDAPIGKGIFCNDSDFYLENSIVFGESIPQRIVFSEYSESTTLTINNSLIQGGKYFIETNDNGIVNWLEGNINQNPQFVNSGDYPYQINDNSPCVDAGSTDTTGITEFDLAGEPRFFNGRIDMGAYEWNTFVGLEEPILSSSNWDINIYPNPFTTSTTFEYTLQQPSSVQITIFNHLGEQVAEISQRQSEGKQQIVWNAEQLPSGVYFYRMHAGDEFNTGKMLIVK